MEKSFSFFENEVTNRIYYDMYYLSRNKSDHSNYQRVNDMLYRRLEYLEEATIKFILSNAKSSLFGSSVGADFLKRHDVVPKKFENCYDLRFLENYLNEIFVEFQCPGYLPSIDDINSKLSIFGFTSETDIKKFSSLYNALKKCDTPLFYEMYETASEKGLSNDEIFSIFSSIFKMLQYYEYNSPEINVLSHVPYLDVEIDEFFKLKSDEFSFKMK